MSQSDLLADVLTRIRNGQKAGFSFVVAPCSKNIKNVLSVLKSEGYIENYEEFEEKIGIKLLKIDLRYHKGASVITEIKRLSKPGRRVYSPVHAIPKFYGGLGIIILSTSHGVLSDEEARAKNVGGELLCRVY